VNKPFSDQYHLYGLLASSGNVSITRIIVLVTSTHVSLGNAATNSEILRVSGSETVTADLLFI
jgi:hypothetical protein